MEKLLTGIVIGMILFVIALAIHHISYDIARVFIANECIIQGSTVIRGEQYVCHRAKDDK